MFSKLFFTKKSSQILIWASLGVSGFGLLFSLLSWKCSHSTTLLLPSYPVSEWGEIPLEGGGKSLEPSHSFFLRKKMKLEFSKLENEIDFYHCEPRPDQSHISPYILKLKKSQSRRPIAYGEKVYLSSDEKEGLSISNNSGDFWLVLLEGPPPYCRIQIDSPNETHLLSKVIEFPVTFQKTYLGYSIRDHPSFLKLGQAKLWREDRLLNKPSPFRLEIQGKKAAYLCNVEEGTLMYYQDEEWIPLEIDDFSLIEKKPLVRISKNSEESLEIEGWDETGEKYYTFTLFPVSVPALNIKTEEWMSCIRMKTQKKIDCLLERQKITLKIGDWIVKRSGKWIILKDENEIQEIYDRCDQELFIFDAIETRNRIKYIQGRFFHSMRTQCLKIEVPIYSPLYRERNCYSLRFSRGKK